jgi:16S rRNA (guanine966-N2)-methyltransferase
MRIIAGEFRSRRLKSLPGAATRPTPDRLRETLFDILQTRIEGATFLDAYAGTGAVGLEALSRGASHVWFLERNRAALDIIRDNIAALGVERRATVVTGPAALTIARHQADIVFIDPPYDQGREYTAVLEQLAEAPPSFLIVQHSVRFDLPESRGRVTRARIVRQGENALSFYAPTPPAFEHTHSVEVSVPRDFAWNYMSNVSNWADPPAVFHLDGPFTTGTRGTTTMPGQPPLNWHLRDVRSPETYTVEFDVPGASFSATWTFEGINADHARLTQRIALDRPNETLAANLAPGMEKIARSIELSRASAPASEAADIGPSSNSNTPTTGDR